MKKYFWRKLAYALRGLYYEEDKDHIFVSDGNKDFGISKRPTSPEPKDD